MNKKIVILISIGLAFFSAKPVMNLVFKITGGCPADGLGLSESLVAPVQCILRRNQNLSLEIGFGIMLFLIYYFTLRYFMKTKGKRK